eukprot:TRINITY_DN15799_c0_g1_i3.p1 TRINITY_DN15799_c0_g1~~TRINITY_DN15799_c0_g1_i3.p1  ORF type:complete len:477 (+),score=100.85 TRINITY_DN15799_c0_g1_i3:704-2134(+)
MVPSVDFLCEQILEEEGVYGYVSKIVGVDLGLIPLEEDVLSLECDVLRPSLLDQDSVPHVEHVVSVLHQLQAMYGPIPHIVGKGASAKMVFDSLMAGTHATDKRVSTPGQITRLILLSRDIDLVTPLCTQLTYAGLIDETFSSDASFVDIPGSQEDGGELRGSRVILNSNDKLFQEVRDMNFATLPSVLNQQARSLSEGLDVSQHTGNLKQLAQFVSKLGTMTHYKERLATHTSICSNIAGIASSDAFHQRIQHEQNILCGRDEEEAFAYIESSIVRGAVMLRVLRLMCLASLTQNGLKAKWYDQLRRSFLHTYGFEHISTLINLERIGLFKKRDEGRNAFNALRKSLSLINEKVDDRAPDDMAYVYSGYAPLSVRLLQHTMKTGWAKAEDVLSLLPGPTINYDISGNPSDRARMLASNSGVTLIFFLEGVTQAEIAALRFLRKSVGKGAGLDFIVATSKIVTGDTLMASAGAERK